MDEEAFLPSCPVEAPTGTLESMVLEASSLVCHSCFSSWRTFSSTDSSRKASLTLFTTSLMTEWYKFAAEDIFKPF